MSDTATDKNLDDMTPDELKALIEQRYEQAQKDGTIARIALIARTLGENLNARYGPKYRFAVTDKDGKLVAVYVDDYAQNITVHAGGDSADSGGKQVLSTHSTKQFIIPGPWIQAVLAYGVFADAALEQRRVEQAAARMRDLLELVQ